MARRRIDPRRLAVALVAAVIGVLLNVATSTAALAIQGHGPGGRGSAVAEAKHRPGAEHNYDAFSTATTPALNIAHATAAGDPTRSESPGAVRVAVRSFSAAEGGSEGFSSFSAAKRALGSPGEGNVYDHVVEQSQIGSSGFSPEQIQNPDNLNDVAVG